MPELPEVETMMRAMRPDLLKRRIEKVFLNRPKSLTFPDSVTFKKNLTGKRVEDVKRIGKYIIIELSDSYDLTLHMRMTGSLYLAPSVEELDLRKHTHFLAQLDSSDTLRFTDPRAFGKIWLTPREESKRIIGLDKLGPDPFSTSFTLEYLIEALSKRRKSIKACLLDQHIIAGVGNIYSDEILFASGINPKASALDLSGEEVERVYFYTKKILEKHIGLNEVSRDEFLENGLNYKNSSFTVYGQKGRSCLKCGAEIERTVISGRSSYYCPQCQRGKFLKK